MAARGSQNWCKGAGVLLVLALLLTACSSDGGSDTSSDDSAPDTTEAGDGGDTTTTNGAEAGGGALVGSWQADIGALLAANTANLGGVGGIDCDGTMTLTFVADGTFSQEGTAVCSVGPASATGTYAITGVYEASDDVLTIVSSEGSGTIEVAGTSQPLDGGLSAGDATYEVSGDQLDITFTDPSVGTVTQTYQRA